jgi:hypothetical protein
MVLTNRWLRVPLSGAKPATAAVGEHAIATWRGPGPAPAVSAIEMSPKAPAATGAPS